MSVLSAKSRGGFGAIADEGMIIPTVPLRVISKPEKL
jgi:hypothetical protein